MQLSFARTAAVMLVGASAVLTACGNAPTMSESPSASAAASASHAPAGPAPIVIDTDLDVSDVGAILALVLDPRVDVRAITITDAGTGVTKCGSARKVMGYLLEELGRGEIPFACGGAEPGDDALPFPPEWRTAADTGWGMDIPPRPETGTPQTAVDLLTRTVQEATEPITIVALGPWTNIAAAAATSASFLGRVEQIHAMAGAVDAPGNVFVNDLTADDHLEWNVVRDPSAFASVFQSDVPITLVPLDATEDVPVTGNLKARLGSAQGGGANLLYEIWVRVPGRIGEGQQLWDELAALTLEEPDLVSWQDMTLAVDDSGRLDRNDAGRAVRVAMSADAASVDDALLQALQRGGPRTTPFALRGTISATWTGASCLAEASADVAPGVAGLEFSNTSGAPAGISIIGVLNGHSWSDLEAYVRTFDPATADVQPDWLAVAGTLSDETGNQGPASGTAILAAGTYGPVCLTGTWPDISVTTGDAFEVAP